MAGQLAAIVDLHRLTPEPGPCLIAMVRRECVRESRSAGRPHRSGQRFEKIPGACRAQALQVVEQVLPVPTRIRGVVGDHLRGEAHQRRGGRPGDRRSCEARRRPPLSSGVPERASGFRRPAGAVRSRARRRRDSRPGSGKPIRRCPRTGGRASSPLSRGLRPRGGGACVRSRVWAVGPDANRAAARPDPTT